MENLINLLNEYAAFISIGLICIVLLQIILLIIIFSKSSRLEKKYKKMMRGTNTKNLEEIVTSYLDKVDSTKEDIMKVIEKNKFLEEKQKKALQKTSIVRYKAFEDVGSDLSFSIALLDEKNDGIILTGIYGRNDSTTYAKPIDKGISRYDLSEEEIQVLNDAINK